MAYRHPLTSTSSVSQPRRDRRYLWGLVGGMLSLGIHGLVLWLPVPSTPKPETASEPEPSNALPVTILPANDPVPLLPEAPEPAVVAEEVSLPPAAPQPDPVVEPVEPAPEPAAFPETAAEESPPDPVVPPEPESTPEPTPSPEPEPSPSPEPPYNDYPRPAACQDLPNCGGIPKGLRDSTNEWKETLIQQGYKPESDGGEVTGFRVYAVFAMGNDEPEYYEHFVQVDPFSDETLAYRNEKRLTKDEVCEILSCEV